MPNKKLTREYNDRRIELIRRIEICKKAKTDIAEFVKRLNKSLDYGIISYETYNNKLNFFLKEKSIEEWAEYYDDSIGYYERELENCESESLIRNNNLRGIITVSLILLILGIGVFYLNPSVTGYFVANEPSETFTDGYGIENNQDKWADINGDNIYARCLKVNSQIEFSEINIKAKITSAGDSKDLNLGIYNHNNESDEPLEEIDNCRVRDYSNIWKSCNIKLENQQAGDYWICAYVLSGEEKETYFTLAYVNGDNKKTALWTGSYWQKLDKASFILKGEFKKW